MPTSDEDLQKLQESVEKKRQELAAATALREERERALVNDETAARLRAEEARLDVELIAVKESAKAANVKTGAGAPLEAAKADMERAVAAQKAAEAAAKASAKASDDAPKEA
jgi:Asp-tRNA(Asn)/Glu-tRNA(Gln) amidotransferase A subunit family amidase